MVVQVICLNQFILLLKDLNNIYFIFDVEWPTEGGTDDDRFNTADLEEDDDNEPDPNVLGAS
jgi:hypothetical protein